MSNMYHYTSVDALYGIIETRKLRLTSIHNMNDADESADKAEYIENALTNLIEQEPDRYAELCNKTLESVRQIKGRGYFLPATVLVPYSCSFVESKDSLMHWSMYGASGQGVAMGFNQDVLRRFIEVTYRANNFMGLSLTRCLYGNVQEMAKAVLDDYIDNPNWTHSGFSLAMAIALNVLGKYKNPLFADENEIRLLLNQTPEYLKRDYPDIIGNPQGIDGIKFATVRGIIRSYYDFDLSPMWKDGSDNSILAELVIGPTSRQNLFELRLFLDNHNLSNVIITESSIPLR